MALQSIGKDFTNTRLKSGIDQHLISPGVILARGGVDCNKDRLKTFVQIHHSLGGDQEINKFSDPDPTSFQLQFHTIKALGLSGYRPAGHYYSACSFILDWRMILISAASPLTPHSPTSPKKTKPIYSNVKIFSYEPRFHPTFIALICVRRRARACVRGNHVCASDL